MNKDKIEELVCDADKAFYEVLKGDQVDLKEIESFHKAEDIKLIYKEAVAILHSRP